MRKKQRYVGDVKFCVSRRWRKLGNNATQNTKFIIFFCFELWTLNHTNKNSLSQNTDRTLLIGFLFFFSLYFLLSSTNFIYLFLLFFFSSLEKLETWKMLKRQKPITGEAASAAWSLSRRSLNSYQQSGVLRDLYLSGRCPHVLYFRRYQYQRRIILCTWQTA